MERKRSLRLAAAIAACLMPMAAMADDDDFDLSNAPTTPAGPPPSHNQITTLPVTPIASPAPPYQAEVVVGAGWQSNVGIRYGRLNGMSNQGLMGLGAFRFRGGDAWDSGNTFYYDAEAYDLGLDTRSASLKFGQQGQWGLAFTYSGMTEYDSNSFHSIWGLSGALVPGVTPGSVKNATSVAPLLQIEDIYSRREAVTANGKVQYGDWLVQTGVRHEHRDGFKENSLAILGAPSPIAANGNITSSALAYFAEPIDYDTDRYDISAQYNTGPMQVLLGYTFNNFRDNVNSRNLANPFQFSSGTGATGSSATAASGSPNITSIYSLPPSNSAHQLKGQFAMSVTPTTRVNLNLQYGLMMQNAPYVAGTGNANLTTLPAPSANLDGSIQTIHFNGAVTTKPFDGADLRVAYTIDDRQNLTPRRQYTQYYQDAYSSAPITPYNMPLNYEHQTFELQGGYRVTPQTKLMLNYTFETTQRNYADTNLVTQSTINAKVRTNLTDALFGSLGYTHEDRQASNYSRNNPWVNGLGLSENEFYGFVNYYEASRIRDEVKTTIDWEVSPSLTTSLIGRAVSDHYPHSALGLQDNNNLNIGPDVSYQVNRGLQLHGYYTYQMLFFNQTSAVSNASCNGGGTTLTPGPAPCLNNGMWTGKNTDDTHTAGASLDWQARDDLKISADYTFSYGRNAYSIANGGIYSFVTAGTASLQLAPIPDVKSMMNSVALHAEYQIVPNASIWFGYAFERLNYKDYGTQVNAAQYSNALFSGDANPSYSIHQVFAALRLRW